MVRIIIPVCGGAAVVSRCLASVYQHTRPFTYELCVVDNASDEETRKTLLAADPDIYIRLKRNSGFVHAVNLGIKTCDDDVVLLNSDTEVTEGWLDKLLDAPGDLVGPITNACYTPQILSAVQGAPAWDNQTADDYAAELAGVPMGPSTLTEDILSFFCVLIRRSTINQIGLLDEAFGLGMGDDNDYCLRARAAGMTMTIAQNVFVFHRHGYTFKRMFPQSEQDRMRLAACNALMNRWGRLI